MWQSLDEVDVVAEVLGFLRGHQAVLTALGGPEHIGGLNDPPYPRLVVTDPPGGDDRGMVHLRATTIQLEVLGDLDGRVGKAQLAAIMRVVLVALPGLRDRPAEPGHAVITEVATLGGHGWSPLPTGQGRYLATRQLWSHPGRAA